MFSQQYSSTCSLEVLGIDNIPNTCFYIHVKLYFVLINFEDIPPAMSGIVDSFCVLILNKVAK